MFVVNPNAFILPSFRIPPFKTEHIAFNHQLPEDTFANDYLDNRFGNGNWSYTVNGREAIKCVLEKYQLNKNDLVTILTTSENFYISSCVTLEIDAVCRWNRELLPETKIIFVNHEFGYPYPNMEKLLALGVPIIEDCCTTFFSQDATESVGKYGDYSVYSLPKFFPIQIGGIIVSNKSEPIQIDTILNQEEIQYIENVLSYNLRNESGLLLDREKAFAYASKKMATLGFSERFQKLDKVVPSVLLLNNHGIINDLNTLKVYLANNGIQSSVFYGEDAFFIPNHQNMSTIEIDFLFEVLRAYIQNTNG